MFSLLDKAPESHLGEDIKASSDSLPRFPEIKPVSEISFARRSQITLFGCGAAVGVIKPVYNHMYIPRDFTSAEFLDLVNEAILCDVAVERQVEITGPDAAKFMQFLSCRDLSSCEWAMQICPHHRSGWRHHQRPGSVVLAEDHFAVHRRQRCAAVGTRRRGNLRHGCGFASQTSAAAAQGRIRDILRAVRRRAGRAVHTASSNMTGTACRS